MTFFTKNNENIKDYNVANEIDIISDRINYDSKGVLNDYWIKNNKNEKDTKIKFNEHFLNSSNTLDLNEKRNEVEPSSVLEKIESKVNEHSKNNFNFCNENKNYLEIKNSNLSENEKYANEYVEINSKLTKHIQAENKEGFNKFVYHNNNEKLKRIEYYMKNYNNAHFNNDTKNTDSCNELSSNTSCSLGMANNTKLVSANSYNSKNIREEENKNENIFSKINKNDKYNKKEDDNSKNSESVISEENTIYENVNEKNEIYEKKKVEDMRNNKIKEHPIPHKLLNEENYNCNNNNNNNNNQRLLTAPNEKEKINELKEKLSISLISENVEKNGNSELNYGLNNKGDDSRCSSIRKNINFYQNEEDNYVNRITDFNEINAYTDKTYNELNIEKKNSNFEHPDNSRNSSNQIEEIFCKYNIEVSHLSKYFDFNNNGIKENLKTRLDNEKNNINVLFEKKKKQKNKEMDHEYDSEHISDSTHFNSKEGIKKSVLTITNLEDLNKNITQKKTSMAYSMEEESFNSEINENNYITEDVLKDILNIKEEKITFDIFKNCFSDLNYDFNISNIQLLYDCIKEHCENKTTENEMENGEENINIRESSNTNEEDCITIKDIRSYIIQRNAKNNNYYNEIMKMIVHFNNILLLMLNNNKTETKDKALFELLSLKFASIFNDILQLNNNFDNLIKHLNEIIKLILSSDSKEQNLKQIISNYLNDQKILIHKNTILSQLNNKFSKKSKTTYSGMEQVDNLKKESEEINERENEKEINNFIENEEEINDFMENEKKINNFIENKKEINDFMENENIDKSITDNNKNTKTEYSYTKTKNNINASSTKNIIKDSRSNPEEHTKKSICNLNDAENNTRNLTKDIVMSEISNTKDVCEKEYLKKNKTSLKKKKKRTNTSLFKNFVISNDVNEKTNEKQVLNIKKNITDANQKLEGTTEKDMEEIKKLKENNVIIKNTSSQEENKDEEENEKYKKIKKGKKINKNEKIEDSDNKVKEDNSNYVEIKKKMEPTKCIKNKKNKEDKKGMESKKIMNVKKSEKYSKNEKNEKNNKNSENKENIENKKNKECNKDTENENDKKKYIQKIPLKKDEYKENNNKNNINKSSRINYINYNNDINVENFNNYFKRYNSINNGMNKHDLNILRKNMYNNHNVLFNGSNITNLNNDKNHIHSNINCVNNYNNYLNRTTEKVSLNNLSNSSDLQKVNNNFKQNINYDKNNINMNLINEIKTNVIFNNEELRKSMVMNNNNLNYIVYQNQLQQKENNALFAPNSKHIFDTLNIHKNRDYSIQQNLNKHDNVNSSTNTKHKIFDNIIKFNDKIENKQHLINFYPRNSLEKIKVNIPENKATKSSNNIILSKVDNNIINNSDKIYNDNENSVSNNGTVNDKKNMDSVKSKCKNYINNRTNTKNDSNKEKTVDNLYNTRKCTPFEGKRYSINYNSVVNPNIYLNLKRNTNIINNKNDILLHENFSKCSNRYASSRSVVDSLKIRKKILNNECENMKSLTIENVVSNLSNEEKINLKVKEDNKEKDKKSAYTRITEMVSSHIKNFKLGNRKSLRSSTTEGRVSLFNNNNDKEKNINKKNVKNFMNPLHIFQNKCAPTKCDKTKEEKEKEKEKENNNGCNIITSNNAFNDIFIKNNKLNESYSKNQENANKIIHVDATDKTSSDGTNKNASNPSNRNNYLYNIENVNNSKKIKDINVRKSEINNITNNKVSERKEINNKNNGNKNAFDNKMDEIKNINNLISSNNIKYYNDISNNIINNNNNTLYAYNMNVDNSYANCNKNFNAEILNREQNLLNMRKTNSHFLSYNKMSSDNFSFQPRNNFLHSRSSITRLNEKNNMPNFKEKEEELKIYGMNMKQAPLPIQRKGFFSGVKRTSILQNTKKDQNEDINKYINVNDADEYNYARRSVMNSFIESKQVPTENINKNLNNNIFLKNTNFNNYYNFPLPHQKLTTLHQTNAQTNNFNLFSPQEKMNQNPIFKTSSLHKNNIIQNNYQNNLIHTNYRNMQNALKETTSLYKRNGNYQFSSNFLNKFQNNVSSNNIMSIPSIDENNMSIEEIMKIPGVRLGRNYVQDVDICSDWLKFNDYDKKVIEESLKNSLVKNNYKIPIDSIQFSHNISSNVR